MVAEVMKMSDKERKFLRQSKWKRLTRQRWFYPTLYIGLVAVVLAGVMIYQFNAADDTAEENANDYSWNVEQNELIESSEEDAAEEDQLMHLSFTITSITKAKESTLHHLMANHLKSSRHSQVKLRV